MFFIFVPVILSSFNFVSLLTNSEDMAWKEILAEIAMELDKSDM